MRLMDEYLEHIIFRYILPSMISFALTSCLVRVIEFADWVHEILQYNNICPEIDWDMHLSTCNVPIRNRFARRN